MADEFSQRQPGVADHRGNARGRGLPDGLGLLGGVEAAQHDAQWPQGDGLVQSLRASLALPMPSRIVTCHAAATTALPTLLTP
ncbi:hypothetical protein [Kutzneria buriramensis]|uniref:hypothetical protein n=1 Tax=Kutzneria buriramensis TaxID=1045776 RepID=UPI0011C1C28A|nr:hypothetical protein [Kutzneria buriramensis]